jgi:amino acid adenylation domain-containing protein
MSQNAAPAGSNGAAEDNGADHGAQTAGLSLAAKRALAEQLLQKRAGEAYMEFAQSYSQRSMWFMQQLDPASPAYHVTFGARIRSPLDTAALKRAVQRLVERHPMLRATFTMGDAEPVQRVAGWRPAAFTVVDATDWDDERLHQQVQAEYAQPFDLESGAPLRTTLFLRPATPLHGDDHLQCAASDHLLMVVAHHIVMDGWSLGLFLNELLAFYAAEHKDAPPALTPPAARYADYVAWQRQLLAGPEGERLWSFWQQELGGELPVLALPTDHPRPPVQTHDGATEPFTIEPALATRLRSLARSEGVTLYTLMLAAWQVLLASYTGQEEILIGSPMAGRSQAAYSSVVGHFVNMVVLRLRSQGDMPFCEYLAYVRSKVLAALDHQEYPFTLLVERLHTERDPSRSPIFQVLFDLQRLQRFGALAPLFLPHSPDACASVAGLTLEPYPFPQQEGLYDLSLQLADADEQILGGIKYSTALFDWGTIAHMRSALISLLEKIVDNPTMLIKDLSLAVATMDLNTFLNHLRKLDIKIWVEGERLRVNAPAGRITSELQKEIGRRKDEIIALLKHAPMAAPDFQLKPIGQREQATHGASLLPLSFSQQRLWFFDQVNPGSAAYNIAGMVRIEGRLDVDALRRSFDEIVRRHEVLRTRIVVTDGQAGQVVDPHQPLATPLVDLQHLPPSAADAEARRLAVVEAARPFDLSRPPLLRVVLYQVAAEEYLMAVICHHIASDGWSLGVASQELAVLYPAFAAGKPSPLPPLPIQYADFAWWQRQWAQGERMQQELAWWQRKLAGPLPVLDLPIDFPRPAIASTHGKRNEFAWDRPLVDALYALSRQEGVTLYMTLLAAFNVLLYRYTRQEDILVGSPVAGREQSETEGLIGFFVNNIVLRTDLSGAPTFRQLLERVRKETLAAFDNQHVPFDRLVDALQPERDASRSPFFQVLFSMQNMRMKELELEGAKLLPTELDLGTTRFDLTLELWEQPDRMRVLVEYCTDLLADETIRRMMGHYATLLQSILDDPDQRIGDLALLTEPERRQLLVEWNATQTEYPRNLPVHRLFEAQAAARPEATAVSYAGERLSYAELNRRANRLARYLQSLGVGAGTLVGIYMERCSEMILALLAVHKAGGAYLPLDPAFPSDRLAFMVYDSQTRFVISQEHLLEQIPVPADLAEQTRVVLIDGDWPQIAAEGDDNLPDAADGAVYSPERLAYVLYTSGSTGRPKGVQVPQRALVNFLVSMQQTPGLTAEDILLSVTTLSFDIAGLEMFLPLIIGAQVEMVSHATAADGAALLQVLQSCGATVMQATPATWRLLIGAGWQGTPGLKILCGGEAMPGELANQLLPRCASLWNMYGPTETTIWSTVYQVTAGHGIMPIGRPIANTQVYILDEARRPTPIGVAGELYIGGDGVAHGYLNRPELTVEKFVPDPFAGGGATMYRTGDLARWRADGNLDFLGRMDFQVKIRGFRIELGEIEAVLDEHPALRQAVVVAREDTPGDPRLVAYLTLAGTAAPTTAPTTADLRGYLKEKLPDYMVPSVFVTVEEFPLTPNGKVNRKALPAPQTARVETSVHHVTPRNDVERRVAAIWQAVLRVEKVGVTDNFFDLGGHSLLIVQVHNQIKRSFETNLTIAQLFQYPTVEALAAYLQKPQTAAGSPTGSPAGNLQKVQDRAALQRAQRDRSVRTSR